MAPIRQFAQQIEKENAKFMVYLGTRVATHNKNHSASIISKLMIYCYARLYHP
jgi:hypothetical protein